MMLAKYGELVRSEMAASLSPGRLPGWELADLCWKLGMCVYRHRIYYQQLVRGLQENGTLDTDINNDLHEQYRKVFSPGFPSFVKIQLHLLQGNLDSAVMEEKKLEDIGLLDDAREACKYIFDYLVQSDQLFLLPGQNVNLWHTLVPFVGIHGLRALSAMYRQLRIDTEEWEDNDLRDYVQFHVRQTVLRLWVAKTNLKVGLTIFGEFFVLPARSENGLEQWHREFIEEIHEIPASAVVSDKPGVFSLNFVLNNVVNNKSTIHANEVLEISSTEHMDIDHEGSLAAAGDQEDPVVLGFGPSSHSKQSFGADSGSNESESDSDDPSGSNEPSDTEGIERDGLKNAYDEDEDGDELMDIDQEGSLAAAAVARDFVVLGSSTSSHSEHGLEADSDSESGGHDPTDREIIARDNRDAEAFQDAYDDDEPMDVDYDGSLADAGVKDGNAVFGSSRPLQYGLRSDAESGSDGQYGREDVSALGMARVVPSSYVRHDDVHEPHEDEDDDKFVQEGYDAEDSQDQYSDDDPLARRGLIPRPEFRAEGNHAHLEIAKNCKANSDSPKDDSRASTFVDTFVNESEMSRQPETSVSRDTHRNGSNRKSLPKIETTEQVAATDVVLGRVSTQQQQDSGYEGEDSQQEYVIKGRREASSRNPSQLEKGYEPEGTAGTDRPLLSVEEGYEPDRADGTDVEDRGRSRLNVRNEDSREILKMRVADQPVALETGYEAEDSQHSDEEERRESVPPAASQQTEEGYDAEDSQGHTEEEDAIKTDEENDEVADADEDGKVAAPVVKNDTPKGTSSSFALRAETAAEFRNQDEQNLTGACSSSTPWAMSVRHTHSNNFDDVGEENASAGLLDLVDVDASQQQARPRTPAHFTQQGSEVGEFHSDTVDVNFALRHERTVDSTRAELNVEINVESMISLRGSTEDITLEAGAAGNSMEIAGHGSNSAIKHSRPPRHHGSRRTSEEKSQTEVHTAALVPILSGAADAKDDDEDDPDAGERMIHDPSPARSTRSTSSRLTNPSPAASARSVPRREPTPVHNTRSTRMKLLDTSPAHSTRSTSSRLTNPSPAASARSVPRRESTPVHNTRSTRMKLLDASPAYSTRSASSRLTNPSPAASTRSVLRREPTPVHNTRSTGMKLLDASPAYSTRSASSHPTSGVGSRSISSPKRSTPTRSTRASSNGARPPIDNAEMEGTPSSRYSLRPRSKRKREDDEVISERSESALVAIRHSPRLAAKYTDDESPAATTDEGISRRSKRRTRS
jgi:hypothetical protein